MFVEVLFNGWVWCVFSWWYWSDCLWGWVVVERMGLVCCFDWGGSVGVIRFGVLGVGLGIGR